LIYTPTDGSKASILDVYEFEGPGVAMAMYNTDEVLI
jgi:isocitrate dehydrogenase